MASPRFDVERYVKDFESAWNEKDPQGFATKYHDKDLQFTDPSGRRQRGLDAFRQVLDGWFAGFSEMKIEITKAVQSGNDVAILQRCTGRHTGEFEMLPGERVPPTNRSATVEVAEFIKLNDQGKIVDDVGILDSAQLLTQLGLLPAPGQAQPSRTVQR